MIDYQSLVVEIYSFAIRPPYAYNDKIQESQGQHELHTILRYLFDKNVESQENLYKKVVQQINQHVTWFIILSIGVVFVMLQFFDH